MPRRGKTILMVLLGLVAVWMAGDFFHAWYVAQRLRSWEASVRRRDDGVQQGCAAYALGTGESALLLIHGINDSPRCYHKLAPSLAAEGFTCRVMRLPGFAEPLPRYARATWQDWRGAVQQEVGDLRKRHRRVAIVAHSLGGAVAITCLLDDPRMADAVVLLAPAIEVSNRRSPILPTRAWHEFGRRTLWSTSMTYTPFETDCHDPAERDYPGRIIFTPLTIVDQTFQVVDHNRGRGAEFTTPLLMVLTKDDQVIDWQAARRFYEQASSQRKAIRFLPDSGHMIPVDYGWKDLTREIADFVRQ